jgi:hypothetical protein
VSGLGGVIEKLQLGRRAFFSKTTVAVGSRSDAPCASFYNLHMWSGLHLICSP